MSTTRTVALTVAVMAGWLGLCGAMLLDAAKTPCNVETVLRRSSSAGVGSPQVAHCGAPASGTSLKGTSSTQVLR